jgi:prevent-host-death family protein
MEDSMNKVIGVTAMQRNFKAVLDEVVHGKISYVLTRGSRPEAVLIPYEDFLRFQQLREGGVMERFDRLLAKMAEVNAAWSEEEVARDLAEAKGQI